MPVRGKKSIADTYVSILPETSRVAGEIAKAFRATDREAREAGRRWKREIETELRSIDADIEVEAHTAKAKGEIDKVARDRTTRVKVEVDQADLNRLDQLMRNRQVNQAQAFSSLIKARQDLKQGDFKSPLDQLDAILRVQAAGANFGRSMQSGASGVIETLGEVGSAARGAGSAVTGIVTVGAIAGLIELAGVAASAAQALALLPAVAGAAGAGIATMVVGFSGMGEAYSAVSKASSDSGREQTTQAKAIEAANRSVVSSQRSYRDAVLDEKHAQEDVARARKGARRELEDLNSELRHGSIDEAQARLDLQKSTNELLHGTFKDSTDYMQAQLNVLSDQQRVEDSHKRNQRLQEDTNETRAKGVDGNDQVVAANERLMHSQENIATALQSLALAQQDAATTATTMPPAMQAASDAMGKLSVNGRQVIDALYGLQPAWEALRTSVNQSLFANVGPQIQQLAGTYLPLLQSTMTGIAGSMNEAFSGIANQLMTPETQAAVQTFLGNVAGAFKEIAPAAAPLAKALADIMAVGSSFLPDLAKSASALAQHFSDFISDAKNDGSLKQFMGEGVQTLKDLGGIAWDLGAAFMALAPTGREILPAIRDMLHDIKDVMPIIAGTAEILGPSIGLWATALKQVETVTHAISTAFEKLKPIIEGVANNVIIPLINNIGSKLDSMLDPVRNAIDLANHFGADIPTIPHIGQLSNLDLSDPQAVPSDTGLGHAGAQQRERRGLPPAMAPLPGLAGGAAGANVVPNAYRPPVGGWSQYPGDSAFLSPIPAGTYNPSGDLFKGLGDCSSAVEDLVNIMDGQPTAGRSMATGNADSWLTAHGFFRGAGGLGDFRVGFNDHHMQATLPGGTPFNWGSDAAAARRGIGGTGADDPAFTSHYYRPIGGSPVAAVTPGLKQPKGTSDDPTYIALSPNVPSGQKASSGKGGNNDAKQFGQDMGSGLLQLFGFDGSLFSDPSQWGITRLFSGITNWATQPPSSGGGGGGGGSTGGGGGLGGILQSFVPQAFGKLTVGSQQDGTVPFMGGATGYDGEAASPLIAGAQFGADAVGKAASNSGNAQGPSADHYGDVNHFNFNGGGDSQGMADTFQREYTVPRARQAVR